MFDNMKVHTTLKLPIIIPITIVVVLLFIFTQSILSFSFKARFFHLFFESIMRIFSIFIIHDSFEGFFNVGGRLLFIFAIFILLVAVIFFF